MRDFGATSCGYHDQSTGSSPNRSGSSNSSSADECSADSGITLAPTQLLALAIKKRRHLTDEKEHDYRRELLHSHLIQNLCKFLGEGRARVRRQRRSRRKFARRWDAREKSGDDGGMSERDQVVPLGRTPHSPILGLAFESTVQNDDGTGGRRRCWHESSMSGKYPMSLHSEGCQTPNKKKRSEAYEDDYTLFELENRREDDKEYNKVTSENGRVLEERNDVIFTDV